jgi:hypothetical protein
MRWLWGVALIPPAAVGVLWLVRLDPDPVPVLLLGLVAVLVAWLGASLLGGERPSWPERPPAARSVTADDRFVQYLHLLEDNERSRPVQSALPDRLAELRRTRARMRGVDPSSVMPERGVARLTRGQIDELVRGIEEL